MTDLKGFLLKLNNNLNTFCQRQVSLTREANLGGTK
jgi:hypothetical protein